MLYCLTYEFRQRGAGSFVKIWEAIVYAVLGGITEVLPVSFFGHAVVLQNALNLSPLWSAQGFFVRAMICLGTAVGIYAAFRAELSVSLRELRRMMRRPRRHERPNRMLRRGIGLGISAFVLMLLSFIFLGAAESIRRLPILAVVFALNGLLIWLTCRNRDGTRTEKDLLLPDALMIGAARAVSVLPGLSSVGSSLCLGRASGLTLDCNLRFSYALSVCYSIAAALYYLIRGLVGGGLAASVLLPMLAALLVSGALAYLSIQYFRYLLKKGKLQFFAYYNWDAAAIILILALINS